MLEAFSGFSGALDVLAGQLGTASLTADNSSGIGGSITLGATIAAEANGLDLSCLAIVRVPNPHDLGTYYTVALFFDDEVPEHVEYMLRIEREGPLSWEDVDGG